MTKKTIYVFGALLLAFAAQANTLVVNPARAGANDANPGSATQPLRTINRAAELVQPGDVVLIHSGVYREKVTINRSGTQEQPIRFEAPPGAAVVITGADPLTGWSQDSDGNKIAFTRGAVLERSRFLNNHGNGVWFDISNVDCTVRHCLIADNEDAGIFYEISYSLHAHDNVVVGNGLRASKGSWGANGGICISNSPDCLVERNLIVGNLQGFCFREQDRSTMKVEPNQDPQVPGWKQDRMLAPQVPIWNHDVVIRDNLILNNRTTQVQGWFDIATERHWPKAMQTGRREGGKAKEDVAAGYQAKEDGVPAGLGLEDLKLPFQGNIYSLEASQPFFIWGANWKRKQEFKDLPRLTQVLGFEDHRSRILPPVPMDLAQRDFRVPKDIWTLIQHAYPKG